MFLFYRLQIIDRGFSNDKQLEVILKSTKENHAEEVKNLENTINHMKNRLENCVSIKIKLQTHVFGYNILYLFYYFFRKLKLNN